MAARRKIDYDSIEPDWRAGIKSVQQLADEYKSRTGVSVTHGAINKHFKARGIPRDLSARIKAKAEAKVSESIVSGKVSIDTIVEANAEHVAVIDISHRKDVRRLSEVESKLLQEFEAQVSDPELFERLGELMQSPDKNGNDKLSDLYRRVISLPGRVDGLKKLTDTMKTRIELERRIVKLDEVSAEAQGNVNLIVKPI